MDDSRLSVAQTLSSEQLLLLDDELPFADQLPVEQIEAAFRA